jgi:hypothetical protein
MEIRGRRLRARPQHRLPEALASAVHMPHPRITPSSRDPGSSTDDLRTIGTSLRLRTARRAFRATIVVKRLSKAGNEAVREVAVGS